jgi:rare lipoprotein A
MMAVVAAMCSGRRTLVRVAVACVVIGTVSGAARAQDAQGRIGGLNPDAEAQQGRVALYAGNLAGRLTASGVKYDPGQLTAAHANLPFGARLRVTRTDNRKSVVVTVNDRMKAGGDLILLVSDAAGQRIGLTRPNVAVVRTELIGMTKVQRPSRSGRQ